ncbi:hypothetical protein GCM10012279_09310 [Micromonospora yangpuensis]|nr:hypothetical protein GCM10012279_09310 [Micromonospora yangpuensis]
MVRGVLDAELGQGPQGELHADEDKQEQQGRVEDHLGGDRPAVTTEPASPASSRAVHG